MRIARFAGIALMGAGAAILVWGDNFSPAPWATVAMLIAGLALVVIDALRQVRRPRSGSMRVAAVTARGRT